MVGRVALMGWILRMDSRISAGVSVGLAAGWKATTMWSGNSQQVISLNVSRLHAYVQPIT